MADSLGGIDHRPRVVVGIDLGTTHSLVAIVEAGRPRVLVNTLGDALTPSVVSMDDELVLVGEPARARLTTHPDVTVASFKRDMGLDTKVQLGSKTFSAPALSAIVLEQLRRDAEAVLGRGVDEAVISVPAYFDEGQRRATHEAARIAGLHVERLVNEPTAAAIAYGLHERDTEQRVVVLDLGGGTFDVTVLEIIEGVIEVQATAGDTRLGGDDFTNAVMDLVAEKVVEEHGVDPRLDATSAARLRQASEQAKRRLTRDARVEVCVPRLPRKGGSVFDVEIVLDRTEVEARWATLIERLRRPIRIAMRDADVAVGEVDAVLLAGGATRMPCVRELVEAVFGQPPLHDLSPDESIAMGAALQAALKVGDEALGDLVVTDVAPFTLGIEVASEVGGQLVHGLYSPILERGTVIPASRVERYQTLQHRQRAIQVEIFQGEHPQVAKNRKLGSLNVKGIPPAPAGEQGIEVRFTYDLNGLLEVDVEVLATGNRRHLILEQAPGRLSDDELRAARDAMAGLKFHPRDALPNTAAIARAQALYAELLGNERELLGSALAGLEAQIEGQDPLGIDESRAYLLSVIASLS